jgi:hypothetical protein
MSDVEQKDANEPRADDWAWKYFIKNEQGIGEFSRRGSEMMAFFFDYFDKHLPSKHQNFPRIVSNIIEHDNATQEEAEERARRLHTRAVERHAQVAFQHFSGNFLKIMNDFFKAAQLEAVSYALDTLRKIPIVIEDEPCALSFNHADTKVLRKDSLDFIVSSTKKRQGRKGRGHFSQWSSTELTAAIQGILALLSRQDRTYEKVTEVLKTVYGDKAPDSPEALRKLLKRFGLSWRKLKADSEAIITVR